MDLLEDIIKNIVSNSGKIKIISKDGKTPTVDKLIILIEYILKKNNIVHFKYDNSDVRTYITSPLPENYPFQNDNGDVEVRDGFAFYYDGSRLARMNQSYMMVVSDTFALITIKRDSITQKRVYVQTGETYNVNKLLREIKLKEITK